MRSEMVVVMANINRSNDDPVDDDGGLNEQDGVLFWVNKSGFPILEGTWERMWTHVTKIHPGGLSMVKGIRKSRNLPDVSMLPPPNVSSNTFVPDRIEIIQKYMSDLQYNHTGTQFYEIRKSRPISGLMDCAKEMIRESLPIKCLEAVILGLYLTNNIPGLDRFPISFKSVFQGSAHRHVVLGLHYNGRYGALGMSRRPDLMYKPLIYKSLSVLVVDYKEAYEKYWHELKKVKIGLPVPQDSHSYEQIYWKALTLSPDKQPLEDLCRELDRHAREMRVQTRKKDPTQAVYAMTKPRVPLPMSAIEVTKPKRSPSKMKGHAGKGHKVRGSPSRKASVLSGPRPGTAASGSVVGSTASPEHVSAGGKCKSDLSEVSHRLGRLEVNTSQSHNQGKDRPELKGAVIPTETSDDRHPDQSPCGTQRAISRLSSTAATARGSSSPKTNPSEIVSVDVESDKQDALYQVRI